MIKNVASLERAPKVDEDEMVILSQEQVNDLPSKLGGDAMLPRAILLEPLVSDVDIL